MTRTKVVALAAFDITVVTVGVAGWIRLSREDARPRHEVVLSHKKLTWDSVTTPQFTMYTVRDSFIATHAADYRRQASWPSPTP